VSEIHGAVGSYVVDALDQSEREEFEAHLATCDSCSQEVAEFSEAATELSVLSAVSPPPALRASVLGAIREVRPLPPETAAPSPPADAGRLAATTGLQRALEPVPSVGYRERADSPPTAREDLTLGGDELAVRRARRSGRWLSAAVAAATVVALALGGWVYALNEQRQAQVAQTALETELLSAPDARVITVELKNGSRASFVVSRQLDRAQFVSDNLADPGSGNDYQLWTVNAAGSIRPDQLVDGGGTQRQFFAGDIDDATALAVSIEPDGGSPQPTVPQIQIEQPL
jgi:anti-sigma-K factor RskA